MTECMQTILVRIFETTFTTDPIDSVQQATFFQKSATFGGSSFWMT